MTDYPQAGDDAVPLNRQRSYCVGSLSKGPAIAGFLCLGKEREPSVEVTSPGEAKYSPSGGVMTEPRHSKIAIRLRALLTSAGFAAVLVSGCSDSEEASPAPPLPSATASTSQSDTWEAGFSAKELIAYRDAADHANAYEKQAQAYFAAGEATEEAKEFFQDNLMTWQVRWADLESYERQGIKIARSPKVLSSQAKSVKLLPNGAVDVTIRRCVDATDLGGAIKGTPLPESTDEPVIQNVDVHKFPDGKWRIGAFETTEKPCDG